MKRISLIICIAVVSVFYIGCEKDKEVEEAQEIEESNVIPVANFTADIKKGRVPLTVSFTDKSENRPTEWLWTLGDNSTSTIENPIRTYQNEGVYSVTLTVLNKAGSDTKTKTEYIEVTASNTPPEPNFTVSPTSGQVRTIFSFDASASTDDYDPSSSLQVRWDFDGDGSWDTDWDTNKTQNHQYSLAGSYTAKLEVKDNEGLTAQYSNIITVIANAQPTAFFTLTPSEGLISTVFTFDASASSDDYDPSSSLQVRWDFEGDGIWDTDWDTNKVQNHQYTTGGSYIAKLEVKDTEGLTSQITTFVYVNEGCAGETHISYGGQTYEITEIGAQCWMAENLNYETDDSWWYDNSSANGDTYGRLYTWEAALTACPTGWHLPSDEEWKTMEMALGMSQDEADGTGWRGTDQAKQMKSSSGWDNNGNGNNTSGFDAKPGGCIAYGGSFSFSDLGGGAYWWSSREYSDTKAWLRFMHDNLDQVNRYYHIKPLGLSIRCLKD